MKRVLVIGATGSLATVVTEELIKQNDVQLTLFARKLIDKHRTYNQHTGLNIGKTLRITSFVMPSEHSRSGSINN